MRHGGTLADGLEWACVTPEAPYVPGRTAWCTSCPACVIALEAHAHHHPGFVISHHKHGTPEITSRIPIEKVLDGLA